MQAFAFNTRRDKFKDPRVRRAFNYAFDFEEMNKQLFFGQYTRIASYFEGTELASRGLPEGEELEILETAARQGPAGGLHHRLHQSGRRQPRGGAQQSARGAAAAEGRRLGGPRPQARQRQDRRADDGRVPDRRTRPSERVYLVLQAGAGAARRHRDGAHRRRRAVREPAAQLGLRHHHRLWGQSLSPGNEQRGFWSSQAADQSGSRNYVGIKDPAVDALIDRVIFAKDRAELVAATKALDRVLLWNHYVVPQWTYGKQRTARWDRFGRPEKLPQYGAAAFPTIWWWDAEGAPARIAASKTGTEREGHAPHGARARRWRRSPVRPALSARGAGRRRCRDATAFRPSATSSIRPTSSTSITSIRTRRRAGCSRRSARRGSTIRTS